MDSFATVALILPPPPVDQPVDLTSLPLAVGLLYEAAIDGASDDARGVIALAIAVHLWSGGGDLSGERLALLVSGVGDLIDCGRVGLA